MASRSLLSLIASLVKAHRGRRAAVPLDYWTETNFSVREERQWHCNHLRVLFISASARLIFPFGSSCTLSYWRCMKKKERHRFVSAARKKCHTLKKKKKKKLSDWLCGCSGKVSHWTWSDVFRTAAQRHLKAPFLHVGWQQQPYLQCINGKSGPPVQLYLMFVFHR